MTVNIIKHSEGSANDNDTTHQEERWWSTLFLHYWVGCGNFCHLVVFALDYWFVDNFSVIKISHYF